MKTLISGGSRENNRFVNAFAASCAKVNIGGIHSVAFYEAEPPTPYQSWQKPCSLKLFEQEFHIEHNDHDVVRCRKAMIWVIPLINALGRSGDALRCSGFP